MALKNGQDSKAAEEKMENGMGKAIGRKKEKDKEAGTND